MLRFKAEKLKMVCSGILRAIGASEIEAEVVADNLIKANLRGVDTHGIRMIQLYVKRFRQGVIKTGANIQVVRETNSTALIDGDSGFGQVAGVKAMKVAIEKAKKSDIAVVGVFNTYHTGMLAYYSMMAIKHDMIGITTCNTPPSMAPWGGTTPILGNNPISFAFPAGKERPIVLDMAVSAVSAQKIRLIKERGEKIPKGWALDKFGQPTTDPTMVYGPEGLVGMLLPIGGYKGYGLSVVADILCGALTGARFSNEMRATRPWMGGNFMIAINIESFIPISNFKKRVDQLIRKIKASPTSPGVSEIRLPGETESIEEEKRLKDGIYVDDKTWQDVMMLTKEL